MGANINYAPPSGNTLPRVDIYADPNAGAIHISENQLMYSDAENYVSVGYIKSSGIKPNTLDVGVIKINKDISNKTIKIEALNKQGEPLPLETSRYVYIHQQDASPPKPGDIRSFRTELAANSSIHSYRITVVDFLNPFPWTFYNKYQNPGFPFAFDFWDGSKEDVIKEQPIQGPYGIIDQAGDGKTTFVLRRTGIVKQGIIIPIRITMIHTGEKPTTFEPFSVDFTVSKLNADRSETVMFRKNIVEISGMWKPGDTYQPEVDWDQTDQTGKPLEKGTYKLSLKLPDATKYLTEGETAQKSFQPIANYYVINIE